MPKANTFRAGAHGQLSSANTTDVQSVPIAANAIGVLLGAQGQDMYVTFDGSVPSSSNGLRIIAGANPQEYNVVPTTILKTASQAASTGKLDYLWLS